ncbi:hypothetical protein BofuT4_P138380.1 [Botrytis cinerea T4]|uniref:Uncharacterized protein n=1 Tax=Botryotinia fuckeliana (strain T4) TaxID=999810 RepID=G2YMR6_BOTF4|nr:hypothetical protein BofuT4_P138380.1 [Botrytis cinerea T4]
MGILFSLPIAGTIPDNGWLQPPHVLILGAFAAVFLRQGAEGFEISVCIMRAACVVLNYICAGMPPHDERCASKFLCVPIWVFYPLTWSVFLPPQDAKVCITIPKNPLEHTSQRKGFPGANLMLPNCPPTPKSATQNNAPRPVSQFRRILTPSPSTMPPAITM